MYFILRNDLAWKMLSDKEREIIKKINNDYNNNRDDYINIETFGSSRQAEGERWDTFNYEKLKSNKVKGNDAVYLSSQLDKYNPSSVLEVGSGPGLFTRMIYDHKSVNSLSINDINAGFVKFILNQEKKHNSRKKFNHYIGDILSLKISEKFDMIVIISSLHHIPDREEVFLKFCDLLNPNGLIVICEPSHYIKRIYTLLKKVRMMTSKKYISNLQNYSTHHMCTKGEYRNIVKKLNRLQIETIDYDDSTIKKNMLLKRLFSNRIHATFKKII